MARQFDKYCQEMYFEYLEGEHEAEMEDLRAMKEAEQADEEYERKCTCDLRTKLSR